jgi:mannose-6-phosphate isomerase-like protein (cupin superfamily)
VANPKERSAGRIRAPMPVRNVWGRELHCANEDQYAAKMLLVKEGKALFIQPQSTETLYLYSGRLWFNLNGNEFELVAGASVTIDRTDIAHFLAQEDSAIFEVSSNLLARLVSPEGK